MSVATMDVWSCHAMSEEERVRFIAWMSKVGINTKEHKVFRIDAAPDGERLMLRLHCHDVEDARLVGTYERLMAADW